MFLVHGMLTGSLQWTPNLASLKRFVRPVLFDLWGHGASPAPREPGPYAVASLVDELERVRAELGAERVVLGGQSLGASLTLRYSIAHPARVIAQVFTNSASALSPPELFGSPAQRAQRAAELERDGAAAVARMPIHPRNARRLPESIRERLVAAADRVDPHAAARLLAITGPALSVAGELHRIACPTLLVNGLWEKRFQPLRALAAQAIPGCRVVDVEAGHAVNLENPEAFDAAVAAFLPQVLPRA